MTFHYCLSLCLLIALEREPGEWRDGCQMVAIFARDVDSHLEIPEQDQKLYASHLNAALDQHSLELDHSQFVLLVDRNSFVQTVFVYWISESQEYVFIGAAPVSTGKPGRFDYSETPLGVFAHSIDNPDYRALGTKNELGIRGYGVKGMRVYDFGWVETRLGWGAPRQGLIRLQMHATDPDHLERFLGTARSKGCVRIPASLNTLIDRYGLLDADYEKALQEGHRPFVLLASRNPTPWSGRYLVVVDSGRTEPPAWSNRSTTK